MTTETIPVKKKSISDDLIQQLEKGVTGMPPKFRASSILGADNHMGDAYLYNPPPPTLHTPDVFEIGLYDKEEERKMPTKRDENPSDNKGVKEKIREAISSLLDEIDATEGSKIPDEITPESATATLQNLVLAFNIQLKEWYKQTGCVVNFGWKYDVNKYLDILGIDQIIFRKEAPSEKTLQEVLKTSNK